MNKYKYEDYSKYKEAERLYNFYKTELNIQTPKKQKVTIGPKND